MRGVSVYFEREATVACGACSCRVTVGPTETTAAVHLPANATYDELLEFIVNLVVEAQARPDEGFRLATESEEG